MKSKVNHNQQHTDDMAIYEVTTFIYFLFKIGIATSFIIISSCCVIDLALSFRPSRVREEENHARILQEATRRKLSMRRPISPYRYNDTKLTKSANRIYDSKHNHIANNTYNYYSD